MRKMFFSQILKCIRKLHKHVTVQSNKLNHRTVIYMIKVRFLNLQEKTYWSINCARASAYLSQGKILDHCLVTCTNKITNKRLKSIKSTFENV